MTSRIKYLERIMILSVLSRVERALSISEIKRYVGVPRPSWLPDGLEAELTDIKIAFDDHVGEAILEEMFAGGLVDRLECHCHCCGLCWEITPSGRQALEDYQRPAARKTTMVPLPLALHRSTLAFRVVMNGVGLDHLPDQPRAGRVFSFTDGQGDIVSVIFEDAE